MTDLLDSVCLQGKYTDKYLMYTRKSLDDADNQRNSIEYQTQKGIAYAAEHKLPIAKVSLPGFCDKGVVREHHSGFKEQEEFEILEDGSIRQFVDRPKFLKLVQLLKQKELKGVIVNCWDRISRNETDDTLIKKLLKQGIDFHFVEASYDKTSAGALHMDIDGIFSRHYSRTIGEKVRNAAKKLRKEGRCIYAAPIGYLDNGSDSKPFDPERAPIVRKLFELYATGEWSYGSLARWANDQGLTTKPRRRKRTKEEILMNVDLETIPKMNHPVTAKHIENILKNPFYTGINIHNSETDVSIAHEALIPGELFYRVQRAMEKRTVTKRYPEQSEFTYRGLVRCADCSRAYSPYAKKAITYYSSRCRDGCANSKKTLSEKEIDKMVLGVLESIHLTDSELQELETVAYKELNRVTNKRNTELESLRTRHKRALDDLDYIIRERISFVRNGMMTMQQVKDEEHRLKDELSSIQHEIGTYEESTKKMLEYVVTFSDLVKNRLKDFVRFQAGEKSEVLRSIFSELSIKDGILKYHAKQGYDRLLARFAPLHGNSGCPHYIVSELCEIYPQVKKSMEQLRRTPFKV